MLTPITLAKLLAWLATLGALVVGFSHLIGRMTAAATRAGAIPVGPPTAIVVP